MKKTLKWIFFIFVFLFVVVIITLNTPAFQRYVAKKVTEIINENSQATFTVEQLSVSFPLRFDMDKVHVTDHRDSVILIAEEIKASISDINPLYRNIRLRDIQIKGLQFNLIKYKEDSALNIMYVISQSDKSKSKKQWSVHLTNIDIINSTFVYENRDKKKMINHNKVDYNFLSIQQLNTKVSTFKLNEDKDIFIDIKTLSAKEKSGFIINNLSTNLMLSPDGWLADYFRLKTPKSNIAMELQFDFKNYKEFSNFIEKVKFDAYFDRSEISSYDIGYFAPELRKIDNALIIDGDFNGTIDNFKANKVNVKFGEETKLVGDFELIGLPDWRNTHIDADVKKLVAYKNDLDILLYNKRHVTLPQQLQSLNFLQLYGEFSGTMNDFTSQMSIETNLGNLEGFVEVNNTNNNKLVYRGNIRSSDLTLGKILNDEKRFNKIDVNANFKGSGLTLKNMNASLDAVVGNFDYHGDNYDDISIKAKVKNRQFDALVNINNHIGNIDIDGKVILGSQDTTINVNSTFHNFDFAKLNLFDFKNTPKINGKIDAKIKNFDIDKVTGYAHVTNLEYIDEEEKYTIDSLNIEIDQSSLKKTVKVNSNIFDFNAEGDFVISTLGNDLLALTKHYLPSLVRDNIDAKNSQDIDFDLHIKKVKQVNALIDPLISLSPNTQLFGEIQNVNNNINLNVKSDSLFINKMKVNALDLNTYTEEDAYKVELKTKNFEINRSKSNKKFNVVMDSLNINMDVISNAIHYDINWDNHNKDTINRGDISGVLNLNNSSSFTHKVNDFEVVIRDSVWSMNDDNMFRYDNDSLLFENVSVYNQNQIITVDGLISPSQTDSLKLKVEAFNISVLNNILNDYSTNIQGIMNGDLVFKDFEESMKFVGDLVIDSLEINEEKLGKLSINSHWNNPKKAFNIDGKIIYTGNKGTSELLNLSGMYYLASNNKPEKFDFKTELSNITMKILQPFLAGTISDISGWMSGEIGISGNNNKIITNGEVKFLRAGMHVDFLGTTYYFSDIVDIQSDKLVVDSLSLFDELGNEAILNGMLTHNNFRNIQVDAYINHTAFRVLNTGEDDNSLFYGDAYLGGDIHVFGSPRDIFLDIQASPAENTHVVIPINSTHSVLNNDFITFVDQDDTFDSTFIKEQKILDEINVKTGFNIDFKLDLNPNAEASIILPFNMGRIDARGSGDLKLDVDSQGQFNMFGKYFINEGNFDLNVQNILRNTFKISEGSYISWSGSPYDADINVSAIYMAKPSLKNLPAAQSLSPEIASERIPVQCIVKLSDKLFNPSIDFSINIPNADAKLKEIVYSSIDTTNVAEMNRQMIYLLLLNSFNVSGYETNVDIGLTSQSFDLLSSQLSSWLSQVSDDFDIGINYRPEDETATEEIEVALSTRLFDDRVLLSGNFGVINGQKAVSNANANTIVGDVLVEIKITQDGRFRIKGFNRTNNINLLEEESPYTQGIGVFYRKEFDYFSELFRRKRKKDIKK